MTDSQQVILISVGNTRTRFAIGSGIPSVFGGQLEPSRVLDNSDVAALSSAIADEGNWVNVAMALAHEGRRFNRTELTWQILDTVSRPAPGYNQADNRARFDRGRTS